MSTGAGDKIISFIFLSILFVFFGLFCVLATEAYLAFHAALTDVQAKVHTYNTNLERVVNSNLITEDPAVAGASTTQDIPYPTFTPVVNSLLSPQ